MHQSLELHGPEPEARPHPNLARHALRCAVCRHPNREIIEDDFLHWRNPSRAALGCLNRHNFQVAACTELPPKTSRRPLPLSRPGREARQNS
jgi:hypothetical protein